MDPDDTVRCPPPDEALALASTIPAPPVIEESEHEPFCIVRRVTFLPSPMPTFDLSDPSLEDE